MPLLLTTPKPAVDDTNDATQYEQVKIISLAILPNEQQIQIKTEYGNTVDSVWQYAMPYRQRLEPKTFIVQNKEGASEYDDLIATAVSTAAGESAYEIAKQSLYQWLIDQGHFAGTIV